MAGAHTGSERRRVRDDLAAVAIGVFGAAVIRRGAFATGDAVVFPALLVALCLASRCRVERPWRPTFFALAALAGWWLVAAIGWGKLVAALPLLGSFVGFGAAAAWTANLDGAQRDQLRRAAVIGAGAFAAAGLVGVALRADLLASQAQGLWRLSSTLAYANAAGLLLAMWLPLVVAEAHARPETRWNRAVIVLVTAGLVASMSRGAFLALVVAAPLARGFLRPAWWPLLLGAGAGLVAVASSPFGSAQPAVIAAALAAVALSFFGPPDSRVAAAGALAVVAVVMSVPGLRSGLGDVVEARLSWSEIDDRTPEWRGAWREFVDDPLVGNGPEQPFVSRPEERTEIARYAHSEPLQVAMSAGLVGLLLLVMVAGGLYRLIRSGGAAVEAVAGLSVFAVGGILDFSWHLPAVGIAGGILAALSTLPARKTVDENEEGAG